MKGSTGGAFPRRCTSGVLTAGALDNKGGHELTTDVGRDIGPGACEVVDLTSAVTRNGRLTGRPLPGRSCGGGLEVPSELNTASSECVNMKPHHGTPLTLLSTQQVSS